MQTELVDENITHDANRAACGRDFEVPDAISARRYQLPGTHAISYTIIAVEMKDDQNPIKEVLCRELAKTFL